jgi:hypothetical protein
LESRPFLELPKPFLCAITNPYLFSHGLQLARAATSSCP